MAVMLTTTPATSCSEHDLVTAARGGDDRAFAELYARYRGRITSYVHGMVRDHGRAEDIAQEAFISALRRLRDTERPIDFKPWVYEIAKNACIDEHRRSKRAPEVPFAVEEELPGSDVTPRSGGPRPEDVVESKQRLDDLRGAFGGLSESHHKVLVMRELEGLSYAEIGHRLGMTRPMVESTLFRARRRLGEEYEELVSGRRCEQVQATIDAAGPKALRSFGIRQRRQLTRHLAHCQPCRHVARMAGWNDAELRPRSIAARVAALLPFPLLRRRWGRGAEASASGSSPSQQLAAHSSLQSLAGIAEPLSSAGLGRAAAVAALALAGAGGGIAALTSHPSARPPSHTRVIPGTAAPRASGARSSSQTGRAGAANRVSPTSAAARRRSRQAKSSTSRRHARRPARTTSSGRVTGGGSSSSAATGLPSVAASLLPVSVPGGAGSSIGAGKLSTPSVNLPVLHTGGATAKNPVGKVSVPPVQVPKVPSLSGPTGGLPTGSGSSSGTTSTPTLPKVKLPPLP
jgi:RNA polymerase sigma factor (sigma-70 family)